MKTKSKNTKVAKKNLQKKFELDNESSNKNRKLIMSSLITILAIVAIGQINFDAILPIKKIRAQGEFINVTENMILDAITNDIKAGYLNVNVHKLQNKIEKLAWVKFAAVRRVWPDSIVVTITEQKAYAFWKNNSLLNEFGEQFKPKTITELTLPKLNGPDNLNLKVMSEYKNIARQLNEVNLSINEFTLDARRAINLSLSNDIKISLGRTNSEIRLKRFITAYKVSLQLQSKKIDYVDMRYTNGFSIKWKENTQAAKAADVLKGKLDV